MRYFSCDESYSKNRELVLRIKLLSGSKGQFIQFHARENFIRQVIEYVMGLHEGNSGAFQKGCRGNDVDFFAVRLLGYEIDRCN